MFLEFDDDQSDVWAQAALHMYDYFANRGARLLQVSQVYGMVRISCAKASRGWGFSSRKGLPFTLREKEARQAHFRISQMSKQNYGIIHAISQIQFPSYLFPKSPFNLFRLGLATDTEGTVSFGPYRLL